MRLVVDADFLEILDRGGSVVLPELLELVDLVKGDLASSELFLLGGDLDEPVEERAVLDEGRPLSGVPDDVLGALHRGARLPERCWISFPFVPRPQSSTRELTCTGGRRRCRSWPG